MDSDTERGRGVEDEREDLQSWSCSFLLLQRNRRDKKGDRKRERKKKRSKGVAVLRVEMLQGKLSRSINSSACFRMYLDCVHLYAASVCVCGGGALFLPHGDSGQMGASAVCKQACASH